MKDEFIERCNDTRICEANFFKELMFLFAKYGVIMSPVLVKNTDDKVELQGSTEPVETYPEIEFEFHDGTTYACDMIDLNPSYYNAFINIENEDDYIGINGIPYDERNLHFYGMKPNKEN